MKKCGEQYRLTRLLKIPEAPGWYNVGGTAVHETTEHFDLLGELNPSADAVREKFTEIFAQETQSQVDRYDGHFTPAEFKRSGRPSKRWPNKEDDAWWLENGPLFVHNWLNYRRTSPHTIALIEDQPAIELHATVELGGFPVELYIDRVMETPFGLVIIDLKSGANMPKDDMQLAVYAEGLLQQFGTRPRWGQFFDCRKAVTSAAYDLDLWPKARLDYEFASIRKIQEDGIFLPNPSNLCSSCGVKDYCLSQKGALAHTIPQPWEGN
jgi:hypothetical protein